VVLEATFGWYWAADVITDAGGRVHLAHPLGVEGFENHRVKNDIRDAEILRWLEHVAAIPFRCTGSGRCPWLLGIAVDDTIHVKRRNARTEAPRPLPTPLPPSICGAVTIMRRATM
jgi:hypothetical protein